MKALSLLTFILALSVAQTRAYAQDEVSYDDFSSIETETETSFDDFPSIETETEQYLADSEESYDEEHLR